MSKQRMTLLRVVSVGLGGDELMLDDNFSLNFGETLLSQYFYIEDIRGRGVIGQEVELLEIPGLDGARVSGVKKGVRIIEVDIAFALNSVSDLRKTIEIVNSKLKTKESKPLIFEDEPDRVYFAICGGVTETFEWGGIHRATVTFICADPYKYGIEKKVISSSDFAMFVNEGTEESFPVVTCKISKSTPFVAIGNGIDINMIGVPVSVDDVVFEPKTVMLNDSMGSTTGWAAGGFTPDGTTKAGSITTNGNVFLPSSYGTGSAWHGPALQKSLSEQLQDFAVEFTFNFSATNYTELGKIQLYGLSATNKKLFMLGMADYWSGTERNMPEGFLYNAAETKKEILVRNENDQWEKFYGYMRITRIGKDIEFFLKMVDGSGKEIATKTRKYYDSANEYLTPLAGIGLHFAQYAALPVIATNSATHITVTKINQATGIPYIARIGDVVTFDHNTNLITINGEDITKEKAFIGNYFPLVEGLNTIVAEPADAIEELEVRWRTAWL